MEGKPFTLSLNICDYQACCGGDGAGGETPSTVTCHLFPLGSDPWIFHCKHDDVSVILFDISFVAQCSKASSGVVLLLGAKRMF